MKIRRIRGVFGSAKSCMERVCTVHPRALLGAILLLCCNMLIVLFVRIKYNFSVEHTIDEKFLLNTLAYLTYPGGPI